MFDVGFWELALIFGMGLMILGPERMPRVAAQIGRWIGRAQRTANQFRRKLQRELELDDLMRDGIVPHKRPARPKTTTKSGNTPTTVGANPHADGQAEGKTKGASADESAPGNEEPAASGSARADASGSAQTGASPQPKQPEGEQNSAPKPPSEPSPEAASVGEAPEAGRS